MVKALLAYQETDAKLRKIEVELASSPARKKMVSAKNFIDNTPDGVNKLDDKALSLKVQYENLLEEQKKITEQQAELVKAVEFAEEQTEMKYLIKKADELLSQIKQISATISKVNEELQKVMKEYNTLRVQNKSAQTQFVDARQEYEKLKASVQEERESIAKELEVLKTKVDPTLMEKYERKRANKIFPIVYEVTGENCGSCRMELSMLEVTKLKNGEIIECEQCGKLLYKK